MNFLKDVFRKRIERERLQDPEVLNTPEEIKGQSPEVEKELNSLFEVAVPSKKNLSLYENIVADLTKHPFCSWGLENHSAKGNGVLSIYGNPAVKYKLYTFSRYDSNDSAWISDSLDFLISEEKENLYKFLQEQKQAETSRQEAIRKSKQIEQLKEYFPDFNA